MSVSPKISVISPSFNCAKYIRRCIEGVLQQNYPNFEHIIVDGASTDGTVEILKEYPHLKWLSEKDSGEAEALNKALKMVSGDIISWLNVDDYYFDNSVLNLIAKASADHPEADVYYGKGLMINEKGDVLNYRMPLMPITLAGLMRWYLNLNLYQPAMFYKTKMVRDVGFFREDLFYSIDFDYWLRIAAKGYRYHFIDRVLAKATLVREGAKSAGSVEDQHENWQEVAASFQDYLSKPERISYWRDFYLYRIRNPLGYKKTVFVPEREESLLGMVLALLEIGDMKNAVTAANQLSEKCPQNSDVYWMLSELMHRTGNGQDAQKVVMIGQQLATK